GRTALLPLKSIRTARTTRGCGCLGVQPRPHQAPNSPRAIILLMKQARRLPHGGLLRQGLAIYASFRLDRLAANHLRCHHLAVTAAARRPDEGRRPGSAAFLVARQETRVLTPRPCFAFLASSLTIASSTRSSCKPVT